jgi:sugar fermentation stimulation protein A
MQLPRLVDGRILRRYKRFLADVELADGSSVTAHCPNTGSMLGCWAPGARVQLSRSGNPKRKLAWTLERVDMGGGWIGVNTGIVNAIVAEGVAQGRIPALAGYARLRREVPFEVPGLPRGRLDLGLYDGSGADTLVEVKNVTLWDAPCLRFPDAVSERGRKHLDLLLAATRQGLRGVILFALNRPEGECFAPARRVDPAYAERLEQVAEAGVEVLAVRMVHGAGSIHTGEGVVLRLDL